MLRKFTFFTLLLISNFCLNNLSAKALSLVPGNLLVSIDNTLIQFDRKGTEISTVDIPHPDTVHFDTYGAITDKFGRVHVLSTGRNSNDYVSTFDPVAQTWRHTLISIHVGDVHTGELTIRGKEIFTKQHRISLTDFSVTDLDLEKIHFSGLDDLIVGSSGQLYGTDNSNPSTFLTSFSLDADGGIVGEVNSVRLNDGFGEDLNISGVVARDGGKTYVATGNGRIYRYSDSSQPDTSRTLGVVGLLNLDEDRRGALVAGSRFGDIVLTNTMLNDPLVFSAGNDLAYVTFVNAIVQPVPLPESAPLLIIACCGLGFWNRKRAAANG